MAEKLTVYGTAWCPKSANLRNHLQRQWVVFDDLDVEADGAAEARVRGFYGGELKFPTVAVGDDYLKNPSIAQLEAFLAKHGIGEE